MSIRFQPIRAFVPAACLLSALAVTVSPSFSQQQPAPAATPAAATPAPESKEPAYPDKRGFFIGLTALSPLKDDGPDVRGGQIAAQSGIFESLLGIGKAYPFVVQGEAGIPVSSTGTLYVDFKRFHGDGTQTLSQSAFINQVSYNAGDKMRSAYFVQTGRIYLDDLLFPHKFPISRFRLKSIWGARFVSLKQETVSPTEDDLVGVPGSSVGGSTASIFYPEFGLAMEYAPTKHTLFRVDGSGFSFPHRSTVGEAAATLSYRRKNLEILMGVKSFHFKTSPRKEEYVLGTFTSPFIGFRWYF